MTVITNKILTGTSSFGVFDQTPLNMLKDAGFDVTLNPYNRKLTKDELVELLPGVVGIIAGLEPFAEDVLRRSNLKVISRVGAGISNIDIKAAEQLNIKVFATPDAPTLAVAELTIAGILNLLRKIPAMNLTLHQGEWRREQGTQLSGKTVCIVGYGRIGRKVAELLRPFGVSILVVDPLCDQTPDRCELVKLDEGLNRADIVTLHCSGEECLIDSKEFALMKKGAYICNVARGGLIREKALIDALKSKHVSGVWLDVFDSEPYSGELTKFDQAILTPHVGSYTKECRTLMERQAVENLLSVLKE